MANWTSTRCVGQMFKIVAEYVSPPNMPSPIISGKEETVRERFGKHADLRCTKQVISFLYPFPPKEVVEYFRQYFGPANKAFNSLETTPDKQTALRHDLVQLWTENNQRSDGTTFVELEYLEVLATKT